MGQSEGESAGVQARVAVVGAGFVGRGLVHRLARRTSVAGLLVVNRRAERAVQAFADAGVDPDAVVREDDPARVGEAVAEGRPAVLADASVLPEVPGIDVVVEATGAMTFGTRTILAALEGGRHVVSMNAEVDALLGHHLQAVAERAGVVYTIGDGDQPGVLLRVMHEAEQLGLRPTVALNCKRNLDVHQNPDDSRPYAERDGTSVEMTTAFGDGTKMHIENVVTANLSGLRPAPIGTPGVRTELAAVADDVRAAGIEPGTVHFTLGGDFGGGVLVLAGTDDPDFDAPYLRYGKLGDGPWYPLFRPYHLIHMEVPVTIDQVLAGGPALGTRTPAPVATCVAVAKRDLRAGEQLDGIGGFTAYGVAATVEEGAELLPIGLSQHATLRRDVGVDQPVRLEDVELDEDAELVRLARQRRG
ncbi:saccharopine dehydrogenase NADP-binding domain-containing protein [Egicoccus halophilus]|nr:SAF domain-containing protein [Egicoccus halophilus]